jgi:hypothetical protein
MTGIKEIAQQPPSTISLDKFMQGDGRGTRKNGPTYWLRKLVVGVPTLVPTHLMTKGKDPTNSLRVCGYRLGVKFEWRVVDGSYYILRLPEKVAGSGAQNGMHARALDDRRQYVEGQHRQEAL